MLHLQVIQHFVDMFLKETMNRRSVLKGLERSTGSYGRTLRKRTHLE